MNSSVVPQKKAIIILLIIFLIALLVRLYLLEKETFWLDETISWQRARLNWIDFLKVLFNSEANMAIYYFLLRCWLILGESEWVIRSLSVVFGVASIPAIYLLGNKCFGRQTALISAGLLALHSFHVRYSQEARSYSLLVLLLILSTYFFIRAVESPREKKFWIFYIITSSLAVYSHIFAIFVLIAQILSLNKTIIKQITTKRFLKVLGLMFLFTITFFILILVQDRGSLNWITGLTFEKLVRSFYTFSGNGGIILLLIYIILIFAAILKFPFKVTVPNNLTQITWYKKLLLFWLTVPIVIIIIYSFIKPVFVDRYMLMCIPALILLSGFGLAKITPTRFRKYGIFPLTLLLMGGLTLIGLNDYFNFRNKNINKWIPLTNHVISFQHSGDCIYYPFNCLPFDYYKTIEMTKTDRIFLPIRILPYQLKKENLENILKDYKRMWFITIQDQEKNKRYEELEVIQFVLSKNFKLKEKQIFKSFGINMGDETIVAKLYVKN